MENKDSHVYRPLYSIRDAAKALQNKNPKLLLYEAIDLIWKEYKAKDALNVHIENFKKVKQIKISGTSTPMPPFDYDDPLVQIWINERLLQMRKKSIKLTYGQFLTNIAEQIECHKGKPIYIPNEEQLMIFDNKITAMASDLWDMEEFDYDSPEGKEFLKEEEERINQRRKHWETKLHRMNPQEMEEWYKLRDSLMKKEPNLSFENASDSACKEIVDRRKSETTN